MAGAQEVAVRYPFVVSRGRVITERDPASVAAQRVALCLGTQVGERVMHPLWGIDIMAAAFEMEGAVNRQTIVNAVRNAFVAWFPDYTLERVVLDPPGSGGSKTEVRASVVFSTPDSSSRQSATVGVAVPGGSEIFAGEAVR